MTGRIGRWAFGPAAPPRPDHGSATVELAASMPALVLLLVVALGAVTAVRTQIECVDAARDAALAAARGDDGVGAGVRVAPPGASVDVSDAGDSVRATVTVRVNPLGSRLPGFTITTAATAAKEPS